MSFPNVTKFVLNGEDLTDKVSNVTFIDRKENQEYTLTLQNYFVYKPLPKNPQFEFILGDLTITSDQNVELELISNSSGTTIRIRHTK